MRFLRLLLCNRFRMEGRVFLDELTLEKLHDIFFMLPKVPANRDADDPLPSSALNALFQLYLNAFCAFHKRHVSDSCSEVLMGGVGLVRVLEHFS